MAPGASTLRLCLRSIPRHTRLRPVRPIRPHFPAVRRALTTTAPRRQENEDGEDSPEPSAQTTYISQDLSKKFERYRKEREANGRPLDQIQSVTISKLESEYRETSELWDMLHHDPNNDPNPDLTRAKFQRTLKSLGRSVPASELDAFVQPEPELRAGDLAVPEGEEPVSPEALQRAIDEERQDRRSLRRPSDLTYRELRDELDGFLDSDPGLAQGYREPKPATQSFWFDEEDDEPVTHDVGGEEFDEDDITSVAHGKLDELREHRHYARIAAWEMPLLSKLAKPFEPPNRDQVLRFRYTTYMGEHHPAERKVVVTFSPADLGLTPEQELKMKKLAGPRYDPEKDLIKMSSESFDHQAQNKRYLSDQVDRLISATKDPADMFDDLPLDLRHHPIKKKPKFPVEWRMTPERRKELDKMRVEAALKDWESTEQQRLANGQETVTSLLGPPSEYEVNEYVPLLTRVHVRQKGKR